MRCWLASRNKTWIARDWQLAKLHLHARHKDTFLKQ